MRNYIYILIGIALCVGSFFAFTSVLDGSNKIHAEEETTDVVVEEPIEQKVQLNSYIVQDGDTFATILEEWGIDYSDMLGILDVASSTYDFTRVRVGRELRYKASGGIVHMLEYDMDTEEMVIVEHDGSNYKVHAKDIEYDVEVVTEKGVIESSLFAAGLDAGISDETMLKVAEMFAWEVDFATEIQKGDSFVFTYEKRKRNGKIASSGDIFAGRFITSGREHYGFYFEPENGDGGYYNELGESLIRQFLKAPLTYSRITSGFSYARFHPALGRTTTHLAIDYGAPLGTPILATADGVVNRASYNGGYGNFVSIRHNGTYTTRYAHLNTYAKGIRNGTVVKQGQIIGYVGSTGFSTGPHLHYEIMENGQLVNPLTIELPAGDPIEEEHRADFEAIVAKYKPILDN